MVAPDFLDSTILHAIGLTIASLEVLAAVHEDRADRSKVADACEFQQELMSLGLGRQVFLDRKGQQWGLNENESVNEQRGKSESVYLARAFDGQWRASHSFWSVFRHSSRIGEISQSCVHVV